MQVALLASGLATQLKVGVAASLPSSSACGRKIWGSFARKLRFGIWVLSLEAFLRRNAMAGLRRVNLEVHISWQAQRLMNLKVQISALCEPGSADVVTGTALWEPRSADFVAGAAFCEPRSAEFVAGAALCEPRSADFVAGTDFAAGAAL